jgi:hypothetical protein
VKLVFGRVAVKGGSQYLDGLHLMAINPGYQPVQVVTAGMYLLDGAPYPADSPYPAYPEKGEWEFPCYIDPSNNRAVTLSGMKLRAFCDALEDAGRTGTIRLVGFYEDGTNKVHKSVPLQFNIDEALKLARAQIEGAEAPGASGTHEPGTEVR